jgi:eukaryotic-like serine/threonine-protein kinase
MAGTVQVWDATTGAHVYIYRGHADFYLGHFTSNAPVYAVAWSPDGKRIASGSNDTTVQVWQAM